MNSITNFNFLPTTVRTDGLVNATALTTAYRFATISEANPNGLRKDVKDWLLTKHAQSCITYLERATGIPVAGLVIAENGVGTWVHPKLAPILAMWISPEFQFAVVELIEREMNSQTPVPEPMPVPQLSNRQLAVEVSESIVKISNNLHNNPRLAQILIDCAMNDVLDQRQLPAAQEFPEDKWYGLVQIADKLGIKTNASTRTKLGQFISKHYTLERVRETRLCNGQQTEIWCYRDDELTRSAIEEWASNN